MAGQSVSWVLVLQTLDPINAKETRDERCVEIRALCSKHSSSPSLLVLLERWMESRKIGSKIYVMDLSSAQRNKPGFAYGQFKVTGLEIVTPEQGVGYVAGIVTFARAVEIFIRT